MDTNELGKKKKHRNQVVDITNAIYGKVPPQAKDLESAVLGAMMMSPKTVLDVIDILEPTDFYIEANKMVCAAIFHLSKTNTIDLLLVVERLRETEELDIVGGPYYITRLTNDVVSTSNTVTHCRIIKQKSLQRQMIELSGKVINECYEDYSDAHDILTTAEDKFKQIQFKLTESRVTNIETIAAEVIDKFNTKAYNAQNGIVDPNVIYTGMNEWDKVNGPLFNGLYIVAGRPGMGKGVHLTELVCRMGKLFNVGVVNAEMTNPQLLTRIGCNLMNIDNYLFKKDPVLITKKEQQLVMDAMEQANQLKLHIENSKMIDKIENRMKLWVEQKNVKCILADFLTLFRVPEEKEKYFTEKQSIDYILRVFADSAYKLKVPIILYVQMNRQIMGRAGTKEPNMSDLKGSGNIEELAYQISMLHRPEYYDETATQDEMGEDIKGLMYQNIIKHRDGPLKKIKHRAILPMSQIRDWGDPIMSSDLLGEELPF